MSSAQDFVSNTIKDNTVVIFSKSYCPYCNMAKDAFKEIGVNYLAIELDHREDCEDIQNALHQTTGARSVPRVFVKGTFIGGGTDVRKLHQSGKLLELVQS